MQGLEALLAEVLSEWPLASGWDLNEGLNSLDDQLQEHFWAIIVSEQYVYAAIIWTDSQDSMAPATDPWHFIQYSPWVHYVIDYAQSLSGRYIDIEDVRTIILELAHWNVESSGSGDKNDRRDIIQPRVDDQPLRGATVRKQLFRFPGLQRSPSTSTLNM
jgi:hypothetical protein